MLSCIPTKTHMTMKPQICHHEFGTTALDDISRNQKRQKRRRGSLNLARKHST